MLLAVTQTAPPEPAAATTFRYEHSARLAYKIRL